MPASPDVMKLADTAPKDTLVDALKQSFSVCTEALAKVTDAQLGEEIKHDGAAHAASRAPPRVITITSDWADHYSTAASYLRLNGILPPTAPPKK